MFAYLCLAFTLRKGEEEREDAVLDSSSSVMMLRVWLFRDVEGQRNRTVSMRYVSHKSVTTKT